MATVTDPRFETRDPRFDTDPRQGGPPKASSPWRTCFIGCLVVAGVVMLLMLVTGIWVWRNGRNLVAQVGTEALNQMIDGTSMPAEERQEMKVEVRRLADEFGVGRVSVDQMGRIVQDVFSSPLLTLFVVSAVEKQYLERSGLSDEEKTEGRRTLRRFVRGAVDQKIKEPQIDAVMVHVAVKQPDGNWEMKDQVSDAELRAALAEANRVADEAEIPAQPEEVDASAELRRIVDEAMKK